MVEKTRSLSRQVSELAARLEQLEAQLGGSGRREPRESEGDEPQGFCALPQVPERTFTPDVSPGRQRLIRWLEKTWVNGTKLRYYFFESGRFAAGNDQKDLVREGFAIWEEVGIGISFEEVRDISEAEIRIGFLRGDGSWSYLGRDVLDIPGQYERTMNFGWDLTRDPRGVDTAIHEIGHTLSFPHEHQNPLAGIEWDEEAVYDYFGAPPNRWDRRTTYHNILRKLSRSEIEGSTWDPDSIMHYDIASGLILRPEQYRSGIRPRGGLSERDIEQVRRFFPPLNGIQDPKLEPFKSERLALAPGEQKNFVIEPRATRGYTIQTFGDSDTVMVLFEDQNGNLKFVAGDDDSGTALNARLRVRLYQGRRYVLRIRLYLNYATGDTAVMMW